MVLQDAVNHVEAAFECELGAPWRWADFLMSKVYQTVTCDQDVPSLATPEDIEHRLVLRFVTAMQRLKQDAGFRPESRPKLFWRWADKIRIVDDVITSRIYIDGNPGYQKTNPSNPTGRPTVGQVRLAA